MAFFDGYSYVDASTRHWWRLDGAIDDHPRFSGSFVVPSFASAIRGAGTMPQFPEWKQSAADLAERGRQATTDVAERAVGFVHGLVDQVRRRVNVLNLATKDDVAAQSRLGRNRVSVVLKDFLAEQQRHDEQFRETLRLELREEIANLAAALDDDDDDEIDLTDLEDVAPAKSRARARPTTYLDDLDDDDFDLLDDEDEFEPFGTLGDTDETLEANG